MLIDEVLLESIRTQVGAVTTRQLGVLTDVVVRRYARAIGETNPLYLDADYARSQGYADVVAPPNLVTAVSVWDEGDANGDLRNDGTPAEIHLHGLPTSGVRVMGGGEDMEFHEPITAGTRLVERSTLVDAELRQGRSGPLIVVRYRDDYTDDKGKFFVTTTRKVLVR
jgi:acyl dehydratase